MILKNIRSMVPDLTLFEVFINYDGPKFYSCHDAVGQLYLAYWIDGTDAHTDWLYIRISAARYSEMKAGRFAPANALGSPEDKVAHLVRFGPDVFEVTDLSVAEIEPEWLPPADYYLPSIDTGLELAPLPATQDASSSLRNVLDFAITQGSRKYEISARTLGRVLDAIQNTVFALSPDNSSDTRKVADSVKAANELFASSAYASSFAVRLKSVEQMFSEDSNTELSLQRLLSLFQMCQDPVSVSAGLQEYGVLARSRFKHLIDLLEESSSSIRLEWASPSGRGERARVPLADIRATSRLLKLKHDVTTETVEKSGTLVGVNVQANSFALFADDELYKGSLAEELRQSSFQVPSRVAATLQATCDIDPLTDRTRWSYVLVSCKGDG